MIIDPLWENLFDAEHPLGETYYSARGLADYVNVQLHLDHELLGKESTATMLIECVQEGSRLLTVMIGIDRIGGISRLKFD